MITPIQVPLFVASMVARVPSQKKNMFLMKWLKDNGEPVEAGDPVVVIDTAKAAIELVTPASGLLFHLVEVDAKVKLRDILGVVADTVEEFQEYRKQSLAAVA
jgi:pyruvate/2-oxoglutarate dehydrogenase complex dihydrolipoamide acyltransferase (E2) component